MKTIALIILSGLATYILGSILIAIYFVFKAIYELPDEPEKREQDDN